MEFPTLTTRAFAKQLAWLKKRNLDSPMFVLTTKIALLESGNLLDVEDLKAFDEMIALELAKM